MSKSEEGSFHSDDSPDIESQAPVSDGVNWIFDVQMTLKGCVEAQLLKAGSICRVPNKILEANKDKIDCYRPQFVAMGPFHRGTTIDLQTMEFTKWHYMHNLFSRLGHNLLPRCSIAMDTLLARCSTAIKKSEGIIRACYGDKVEMASEQFSTMMLLDACFLFELLLWLHDNLTVTDTPQKFIPDYINDSKKMSRLLTDLTLLENQIPFFLLILLSRIFIEEVAPPQGQEEHPAPPTQGQEEQPAPPPQGQEEHPAPPTHGQEEQPAPPPQGQEEHPASPPQGQEEHPAPPTQGQEEQPAPPPQGQEEHPAAPPQGQEEHPAPPPQGQEEQPAPPPQGQEEHPAASLLALSEGAQLSPQRLARSLFQCDDARTDFSEGVYHFLHLMHSCAPDPYQPQDFRGQAPLQLRRCARKLQACGIKIKCHPSNDEPPDAADMVSSAVWEFMDKFEFAIRFNETQRELIIPTLHIKEATEAKWRNFIAWEQRCRLLGVGYKFTPYGYFFKSLVCSVHDIQLLKEKGVIRVHTEAKDEDLRIMFKSIVTGAKHWDARYRQECERLNKAKVNGVGECCVLIFKLLWHYWRRLLEWIHRRLRSVLLSFIDTYLGTPWKFIGVLSGAALLGLTITQTIYDIRAVK